jgi:hypothetical protein
VAPSPEKKEPRHHQRPVGPYQLHDERNDGRQRERPRNHHRAVADDAREYVEPQRKRARGFVVKQRSEFQIELGIDPEQQPDHEREGERDYQSGPVHGAGFSRDGKR